MYSEYLDTAEGAARLHQLPVLIGGLVLWAILTLLSARVSVCRFERVDL